MSKSPGRIRRPVRSIFVSDVHLGCRHAQSEPLLSFLESYQPEHLYLVGDFIDGWKLRRSWRWESSYSRVFQQLALLARRGTRVAYTPGNHDAFLRNDTFLRSFLDAVSVVDVADEFVHETADGRRFLVTHGDRFDRFESTAQWASMLASAAYDLLLSLDNALRWLRRGQYRTYGLSAGVKGRVKRIVQHISDFERLLSARAEALHCQGVICGHIHVPKIAPLEGITYCNTGDWVEHCTALIEEQDGRLELLQFLPSAAEGQSSPIARVVRLASSPAGDAVATHEVLFDSSLPDEPALAAQTSHPS